MTCQDGCCPASFRPVQPRARSSSAAKRSAESLRSPRCRSGCTAVGGQPLMRPGTDGWGSVPSPNGSALRLPAGGEEGTHGGKAVDRSPRVPVADELLHLLRRGPHPGSALHPSPEQGPGAGRRVEVCLAWLPAPVVDKERYLRISHHRSQNGHRTSKPGCRVTDCWSELISWVELSGPCRGTDGV